MTFLHQRREPEGIIFYGITKNDTEDQVRLEKSDFENDVCEFDSVKLSNFKIINKAYVWFGRDDSNKI
jgi:hypothetical protein